MLTMRYISSDSRGSSPWDTGWGCQTPPVSLRESRSVVVTLKHDKIPRLDSLRNVLLKPFVTLLCSSFYSPTSQVTADTLATKLEFHRDNINQCISPPLPLRIVGNKCQHYLGKFFRNIVLGVVHSVFKPNMLLPCSSRDFCLELLIHIPRVFFTEGG